MAQVYRLLDVARGVAAIRAGATAGTLVSRTRDAPQVAEAALDYGFSQRAVIAVAARSGDIAELITGRIAACTRVGAQDLDAATVRAVVHQAVRELRAAPPEPPDAPPADPGLAELRRVVADLAVSAHAMGELFLEVAPAYLCDTTAADVLGPLCDEIGNLDTGLATRRYALTGDRRALHGIVL
ncbi:hypothetical protein ACFYM0_32835 [Streptomyces sp. NPDC006487]|uniref:hypothetical protein n=1 Tax=Streptomyces sp. NPDC006487 TaxID=3364748 RepID=UPI0036780643